MQQPIKLKHPYTALVAGSTGATGRRIVAALTKSDNCEKICPIARREIPESEYERAFPGLDAGRQGKIQPLLAKDYEVETMQELGQGLQSSLLSGGQAGRRFVAFSALGSAPFSEKVDLHYSLNFARLAGSVLGANLHAVGLVSSSGANPNSYMSYLKVIGQREEEFKKVFAGTGEGKEQRPATPLIIARPGPIDRDELAQERMKERLLGYFRWLIPHVHASQIAQATVWAVEKQLWAEENGQEPTPVVVLGDADFQKMQREE